MFGIGSCLANQWSMTISGGNLIVPVLPGVFKAGRNLNLPSRINPLASSVSYFLSITNYSPFDSEPENIAACLGDSIILSSASMLTLTSTMVVSLRWKVAINNLVDRPSSPA